MVIKIIFKLLDMFMISKLEILRYRNKDFETIYFRLQMWLKKAVSRLGYKIEVNGLENLQNHDVIYFVSNHQGILDPAVIIATCPYPMTFISKDSNGNIPIIKDWINILEVILFDRDDRASSIKMLREVSRQLENKRNILVFPEGTRSKSYNMNSFKDGALQPAYSSKATIIPITVNNTFALEKNDKTKDTVSIMYGKPIPYPQYHDLTRAQLTTKIQDEISKHIVKE